MPLATPMAAKFTAWRPEPQKRFSDTPVTSFGQPAASAAMAADAGALLADLLHAAGDHVLDVAQVEAGALAGRSAPAPGAPADGRPRARRSPCPFRAACARRR